MTFKREATIQERVADGADLLDAHVPGWWQVINIPMLSLENCGRCILGQLGGYTYWLSRLGDYPNLIPARFGFDVYQKNSGPERDKEFEDLRIGWIAVIQERRSVL